MDHHRFDRIVRSLSTLQSRRGLLGGLLIGAAALPTDTEAKKKRKKKAKFNSFGCVNVGEFCKNSSQCCSGICEGKPGKGRCQAHNSSNCPAEANACDDAEGVRCTSSAGAPGFCDHSTGNAPYCSADGDCFACKKDADCVPFCGAQAACVVCAACANEGVTTSCVGPAQNSCTFPNQM